MLISVSWWLSIPRMSTVRWVLNRTRTSFPAIPPLAPRSIRDISCLPETLDAEALYMIRAILTDRVEALDRTRRMSPGGSLDLPVLAAFTRRELMDGSSSLVSGGWGSSCSIGSMGSWRLSSWRLAWRKSKAEMSWRLACLFENDPDWLLWGRASKWDLRSSVPRMMDFALSSNWSQSNRSFSLKEYHLSFDIEGLNPNL